MKFKSFPIFGFASLICGAVFTVAVVSQAVAMGNHPEANVCPADKPYFVFCSHSLHNLEGWYGDCYKTREEAEAAAKEHAQKEHAGNTRWTGAKHVKSKTY